MTSIPANRRSVGLNRLALLILKNCRDDVGPMVRIGATGAGVGIGVDALIRGRRTIYVAAQGSTRLHAAPILARHARGLQVSLSF